MVKNTKVEEKEVVAPKVEKTELEELRELHKQMKERAFNSIGDIEVRMSRLV